MACNREKPALGDDWLYSCRIVFKHKRGSGGGSHWANFLQGSVSRLELTGWPADGECLVLYKRGKFYTVAELKSRSRPRYEWNHSAVLTREAGNG